MLKAEALYFNAPGPYPTLIGLQTEMERAAEERNRQTDTAGERLCDALFSTAEVLANVIISF